MCFPQVDWYIHKVTTAFTYPTMPPVPSSKTVSAPPYYLGSAANMAGGQGTTYDMQLLRMSTADMCGSAGNTFCTATIVLTSPNGSKFFGARSTFRALVLHEEG